MSYDIGTYDLVELPGDHIAPGILLVAKLSLDLAATLEPLGMPYPGVIDPESFQSG